ncbi:carboxypeptidase-like regulatory domain-containing protein [Hymenobacter aerilatus]|uniref:Carboxypeptidase-like regulatory domain-containing protein n=1 Tax=Hymenobacter aerilatus TaxID=2932251 RepID=A0A8T9SRN7_9BACT|nr:carboxypeptidase-like regulatory domain-containing protein [Hymenobacter aerilatus]UOR04772.1 carboxypeptidase-like regulatory domain-containing protein [Hymenobacter aerilatus]
MLAPTLSVPTPCHENWQQMTPATNGRHCAACQTVVVDFTHFTDAELLAYLGQHAGQSTCGRFRAEQLGRPLQPTTAATVGTARWRTWLAAAVAVWGLREVAAPAVRAQVPLEQREPTPTLAPITLGLVAPPPVTVHGVVTDADGPLPGVTVLLPGTQLGAVSDTNGRFELTVPPAAVAMHLQLTVSYIGYQPQHVAIPTSPNQTLHVVLTPDVKGMLSGEVVVVDGYSSSPWYTPRGLWQRVKRPFQRW